MLNKRVSFETLGCRYNRFESAEMAYEFGKAGFTAVKTSESPDVVVINSCAVTNKSAARCRAAIRGAKGANPGARIVVTGCYSETSPEAVSSVEGVDLVIGNAEKFDIADALGRIGVWSCILTFYGGGGGAATIVIAREAMADCGNPG